ncbi:RsmE family RNA methyltransferase, partial [Lacticaseibacillus rhamnosus]
DLLDPEFENYAYGLELTSHYWCADMNTGDMEVPLSEYFARLIAFELDIETATELGVSVLQPFEAARTTPGLFEASAKRLARWQKVALEASQQSRRLHLPEIHPAVRFEEALEVDLIDKRHIRSRIRYSLKKLGIGSIVPVKNKTLITPKTPDESFNICDI